MKILKIKKINLLLLFCAILLILLFVQNGGTKKRKRSSDKIPSISIGKKKQEKQIKKKQRSFRRGRMNFIGDNTLLFQVELDLEKETLCVNTSCSTNKLNLCEYDKILGISTLNPEAKNPNDCVFNSLGFLKTATRNIFLEEAKRWGKGVSSSQIVFALNKLYPECNFEYQSTDKNNKYAINQALVFFKNKLKNNHGTILAFDRPSGEPGHAVVMIKTPEGELKLIDNQIGEIYHDDEQINEYFKKQNAVKYYIFNCKKNNYNFIPGLFK